MGESGRRGCAAREVEVGVAGDALLRLLRKLLLRKLLRKLLLLLWLAAEEGGARVAGGVRGCPLLMRAMGSCSGLWSASLPRSISHPAGGAIRHLVPDRESTNGGAVPRWEPPPSRRGTSAR